MKTNLSVIVCVDFGGAIMMLTIFFIFFKVCTRLPMRWMYDFCTIFL